MPQCCHTPYSTLGLGSWHQGHHNGPEEAVLLALALRQLGVGNQARVRLLGTVLDRAKRPAILDLVAHPGLMDLL